MRPLLLLAVALLSACFGLPQAAVAAALTPAAAASTY